MASMINGVSVYKRFDYELFQRLGVEGLLEWKLEKNFFFIPGHSRDLVERAVGEENRNLVRQVTRVFVFLLSVVNRMDQDPTDIPFDEIIPLLRTIEAQLDADNSVDLRSPSIID
jgi:hypothetical protein